MVHFFVVVGPTDTRISAFFVGTARLTHGIQTDKRQGTTGAFTSLFARRQ